MNKQTDPNIKTIRFPITADSKLQKMCDKCGLTRIDFFIAMVDYFYKSKKDPRDLNDELLKKEIIKRSDNIIGFIRTQESDLLIPLKKDSERQIRLQTSLLDIFNKQVLPHAQRQEAFNKEEVKLLNDIWQYLMAGKKATFDREKLKKCFSEILEKYIRERDQMGMMTKQSEKDSLADQVRMELQMIT
jgi:hypothetical protein